jgi:hypothetical protein
MTRQELIAKLTDSVGAEKAIAAVDKAARDLGFGPGEIDHDRMLLLLERLAADPGIVGTVARFAKVRVILAGPPPLGLGIVPPKRR